jgi:nucleotidyltransferase/DNA polymerase involved in DNA repair
MLGQCQKDSGRESLDSGRTYRYAPAMIGHIDADCFYVSCERVRNSALRGQPVGVLGNQGACVIAKSYEMKARGVKTGTPIWDAVEICPDGIYVKRDFRWYEVISRRILNTVRQGSPTVEYYSIDEMFFDASRVEPRQLQNQILDEIGVPVSIGISTTKTLAKLVSDTAKPFGCRVLMEPEEFLRSMPVQEISGIAERSRLKLAEHDITTCWDLVQADRHLVRRLLTVKGEGIWWELHGTPVQPILTSRPPHKCISRGGSIGEATADKQRISAWVVRNVERLVEELDYHQVLMGKFVLAIESQDAGCSGTMIFPDPTASFKVIVSAAKHLLSDMRIETVSGMHLFAERLTYRHTIQGNLFFRPGSNRASELKRLVNQKMGRFAIRSGETLFLPDIYQDEANEFDICDVHGKICF